MTIHCRYFLQFHESKVDAQLWLSPIYQTIYSHLLCRSISDICMYPSFNFSYNLSNPLLHHVVQISLGSFSFLLCGHAYVGPLNLTIKFRKRNHHLGAILDVVCQHPALCNLTQITKIVQRQIFQVQKLSVNHIWKPCHVFVLMWLSRINYELYVLSGLLFYFFFL